MKFLYDMVLASRRRLSLEVATVLGIVAAIAQKLPVSPLLFAYIVIVAMNAALGGIRFFAAVRSVRIGARSGGKHELRVARFLLSAFDSDEKSEEGKQ